MTHISSADGEAHGHPHSRRDDVDGQSPLVIPWNLDVARDVHTIGRDIEVQEVPQVEAFLRLRLLRWIAAIPAVFKDFEVDFGGSLDS